MGCGADFYALPEECIANILSFTTPADACRLSLVSKLFGLAADSDVVWSRFLPSDYKSIIAASNGLSPSVIPLKKKKKKLYFRLCNIPLLIDRVKKKPIIARSDGSSPSVIPLKKKKKLYFRLCNASLLIEGGNKRFFLDKWSGKKCYMIAPRELTVTWRDRPQYWVLNFPIKSRFEEVGVLCTERWLEICGKINTGMLSPETLYAAYLVCKFRYADEFINTPVDVLVGIMGGKSCMRTVYLNSIARQRRKQQIVQRRNMQFCRNPVLTLASQPSMPREKKEHYPKKRGDGWLEIELGKYFNEGEAVEELKMSLIEVKHLHWKGGLVIKGIEIRPKRV